MNEYKNGNLHVKLNFIKMCSDDRNSKEGTRIIETLTLAEHIFTMSDIHLQQSEDRSPSCMHVEHYKIYKLATKHSTA